MLSCSNQPFTEFSWEECAVDLDDPRRSVQEGSKSKRLSPYSAKYPGRARTWAPGRPTLIRTRRQLPSNTWLAG